jgi:hypothetical protein
LATADEVIKWGAKLLRCTLVANGTKRHFAATQQTVAFGGKADIEKRSSGVGALRAQIWLCVFVGSTIGGFIPAIWGGDLLSYSGLLLSTVGAFVGLWVGYKLS